MLHHRCFLPILVTFMLGSLVAVPPRHPAQAADERCFPENGQCISGRIRAFWEQNGGLAVFGYPISAPNQESIRDTGDAYLTQWPIPNIRALKRGKLYRVNTDRRRGFNAALQKTHLTN